MDPDAHRTNVKICGTTSRDEAELTVELGAWALGMIFWERSPRRCELADADEISRALRRRVELCGVFVNESLDRITAIAEQLRLSIVQLHGDEGPAFCAEVRRRTGARVCKAVQVGAAGDVRSLERYHVDYRLVDGRGAVGQRGGTGNAFDWSLLAARPPTRRGAPLTPLILSGGLTPENVAEAIATVNPFAVDVASGVEASPGRKDPDLMRAFFEAVRSAGVDAASVGAPDAASV
ncbi:MAG: phosphoribosylanthranilate isomerase, partial [Solirubrobacteraceae bacterium]